MNTTNSIPNNDQKDNETLMKSRMLWGSAGDEYTIISNQLIFKKTELGITDAELHVILILASHKHTAENPWPSIKRLCECRWGEYNASKRRAMNLLLESLEKKSLLYKIKRKSDKGQLSNGYDLTPLIERLENSMDKKEHTSDPNSIGDESKLHGEGEEILHGGDESKLHGEGEAELHPKKNLEKEILKKELEKENTTSLNNTKLYSIEDLNISEEWLSMLKSINYKRDNFLNNEEWLIALKRLFTEDQHNELEIHQLNNILSNIQYQGVEKPYSYLRSLILNRKEEEKIRYRGITQLKKQPVKTQNNLKEINSMVMKIVQSTVLTSEEKNQAVLDIKNNKFENLKAVEDYLSYKRNSAALPF